MRKPTQTHTAKFFKRIMREMNIRYRRDLAFILGVSEDKISKYMNSDRQPSFSTCLKIQNSLEQRGFMVSLQEIRKH